MLLQACELGREVRDHRLIAVGAGLVVAIALITIQAASSWQCHRRRSRHRQLLRLVASHDIDPGVRVLDHPAVTAYYLPGRTGCVVISNGAPRALSPDELTAVLTHEQAHARYHHHVALAPFHALRRAVPLRPFSVMANRMDLLVELFADDEAARRVGRGPLLSALRSMRHHGLLSAAPPHTLAAAATALDHRIDRLDHPIPHRRSGALITTIAVATALVVAATPVSLFAFPL